MSKIDLDQLVSQALAAGMLVTALIGMLAIGATLASCMI